MTLIGWVTLGIVAYLILGVVTARIAIWVNPYIEQSKSEVGAYVAGWPLVAAVMIMVWLVLTLLYLADKFVFQPLAQLVELSKRITN